MSATATTVSQGAEDDVVADLDAGPVAASTRIVSAAVVAVMVGCAGLAWTGVYALGLLLPGLLLGAVVPTAVVVAVTGSRGTGRSAVPLVAGLGATAVVAVASVLIAGGTIAEALGGFVTAWSDLLSRSLPVDGEPVLALVPATTVGVAATVAALLVRRSRSTLLPVVPAVALIVVARLLGGPAATPTLALAGVVVAAALLGATRTSLGTMLRVLPVAVAAAAIALLLGAVLPWGRSRPALNLRDQREQSLDELAQLNPLATVRSAVRVDPTTVVAAVTLDGPAPIGGVLPMVSLDTFDGSGWSSSASYERTGTALPASDDATGERRVLRQDLEIRADTDPWVPVASRAIRIVPSDGSEALAVDPRSGAVASTRGALRPGSRFAVESLVPDVSAADAQRAAIPSDPALRPASSLPDGAPPPISAAADEAMRGAASPFQQAAALEAWLQTGGRFTVDPDAPGGTSYGIMGRFLAAEGPNARIGTEQQFVTAFALMARSHGLPTRLTVGYRLPDGGQGTGSRTYELRRMDLDVWPEIAFTGVGWVPFDPVPRAGGPAAPVAVEPDPVEVAKQEAAQLAADPSKPPAAAATNPVLQAEAPATGGTGRLASAVVGAAIAIALLLGVRRWVLPALRTRRTRRARRAEPDPRTRALGAWYEVVDALGKDPGRDADALRAGSVPEIVQIADAAWGEAAAPVHDLGRIVTGAAFDPDGATDAQADEAWRLVDALPDH